MNEYEAQQRKRDREYLDAWKNLSPRQRKQLEKAGITGPDAPVYRTGKRDDEDLVNRAGQPPAELDEVVETPAPPLSSEDLMATLRKLVGELMSKDNIRLTLECFALVTNIEYDGESMTTIARRFGVSRAAVSKRCVELTEALGLPPPRAMKQLTARMTYERRARSCHSRDDH